MRRTIRLAVTDQTVDVHHAARDDSQQVFEYGCHEGNLGLEHILSAARAEEGAAGRR
jgi:hypothetical protein